MAVGGNSGGAGGAKNLARVQRQARRARKRSQQAPVPAPAPAPRRAPAPRPAPIARAPAAPSPAVKERHQRIAQSHTANAKRATSVRRARAQTFRPLNQPGLPPEVRHPAGRPTPAPAPVTPVRTSKQDRQLRGLPPEVRHPKGFRTTKSLGEEKRTIDHHVGHLLTKGKSLTSQEHSIDKLRAYGVTPGTSKFDQAIMRRDKKAADELAAKAKRDGEHKGSGVLKAVSKVVDTVEKTVADAHTPISPYLKGTRATLKAVDKYSREADRRRQQGKHVGTGLAAVSMADQVLSGTTGAQRKIGKALAAGIIGGTPLRGPYAAARAAEPVIGKKPRKFIEHAAQDTADLVTNFVPSAYVPAKHVATGDTKQAVKDVTHPITELYHHPGRQLYRHPVGSVAAVAGPVLAAGRGAGAVARGAERVTSAESRVGRSVRAVGSQARAPLETPGTSYREHRQYHENPIVKGAQVIKDVRLKQRGKNEPAVANPRQLRRAVNVKVRGERGVSGLRERDVVKTVREETALPAGKVRKVARRTPLAEQEGGKGYRGATAAHTLAVQGLLREPTLKGLRDYKAWVAQRATHLEPESTALAENLRHQAEVQKAIDNWKSGGRKDTEKHLRALIERFSEHERTRQAELEEHGVLKPGQADVQRFTPAAIRRGHHDPETASEAIKAAEEQADQAAKHRRRAKRRRDRALNQRTGREREAQLAEANAPKLPNVEPVRQANREHVVAQQDLKAHTRALEREATDAQAALERATRAAKRQAGPKHADPAVLAAEQRLVRAQRELKALEGEAFRRERVSGRQEGRAQEKVRLAESDHKRAVRAAEKEDDAAQKNLATRYREEAAARDGDASEAQLASHARHVRAAELRADKAGRVLDDLERNAPEGTQPHNVLARLEARGGQDLAHAQKVKAKRVEVADLADEHAKSLRDSRGVPEPYADALRDALDARDAARARHRGREGVQERRDRVVATRRELETIRKRYKLAPAVAQKVWDAMHQAEHAAEEHQRAIVEHESAKQRKRDLKGADFINAEGQPRTVADVQADLRAEGQPDPSFIAGKFEAPHAAIPLERVNLGDKERGTKIAQGRLTAAPEQLLSSRLTRQRAVGAAAARRSIIDQFGARGHIDEDGNVILSSGGDLLTRGTEAGAHALADKTNGNWRPLRLQEPGKRYALVPEHVHDQLERHELGPRGTRSALGKTVQGLGRNWRSFVLGTSTKWLTGQYVEGALRLMVQHGFNPLAVNQSSRYMDATLKAMEARDPRAAEALRAMFESGSAGRLASEARQQHYDDFMRVKAGADLTNAWRRLKARPSAKVAGRMLGAYMDFVFHDLNGSYEARIRKAMLGKELRDLRPGDRVPLLGDKAIVGDFDQAFADALAGRKGTDAQVHLVRRLDDAFGQYQGRSPLAQQFIESATPFIPWWLNAVKFVSYVMPRDHPILTTLMADAQQASEQWRRKYGLQVGQEGGVDISQQGSLPFKKGQDLRNITHYTPFGALQGINDMGSFFFPQAWDVIHAFEGEDWRGRSLTGNPFDKGGIGVQLPAVLSALAQTVAPPIQPAARIGGVTLPNETPPPEGEEGTAGSRALKFINPFPARKGKGIVESSGSSGTRVGARQGVTVGARRGVKVGARQRVKVGARQRVKVGP
jgi:hypothetical protein